MKDTVGTAFGTPVTILHYLPVPGPVVTDALAGSVPMRVASRC